MQETKRKGIARIEVRNIKGLRGSKSAVEETIESRKKKRKLWDAIIFTETMTEEGTEVKLEGFNTTGGTWATREAEQGRPKGGIQGYTRKRSKIPMQRIHIQGAPSDSIVLIVGDKRRGKAYAVFAYRRAPTNNGDRDEEEIDSFFNKAKATTEKLIEMGYRVITAGDANGHLGELGRRLDYAGRAWNDWHERGELSRVQPRNKPGYTFYSMREEDYSEVDGMPLERARTAVDFLGASEEAREGIKNFEINIRDVMRTDHGGLLFELETEWRGDSMRPKEWKKQEIPKAGSNEAEDYKTAVETRLKVWNQTVRRERKEWNKGYVQRKIEELEKILVATMQEVLPPRIWKEKRRKASTRQKERHAVLQRVKALAIRQAEREGAGQAWGEFIREVRFRGQVGRGRGEGGEGKSSGTIFEGNGGEGQQRRGMENKERD